MAYNASIEDALCHAYPQTGQPSAGSTLDGPAAHRIWRGAFAKVRMGTQAVGLTVVTTTDSDALEWFREAEALFASGEALRAQMTVAQGDQPIADRLVAKGEEMLASLKTADNYGALLSMGATATSPTASWRNRSNWTEGMDPDFDETPGTGDVPYAVPPQAREGDPT